MNGSSRSVSKLEPWPRKAIHLPHPHYKSTIIPFDNIHSSVAHYENVSTDAENLLANGFPFVSYRYLPSTVQLPCTKRRKRSLDLCSFIFHLDKVKDRWCCGEYGEESDNSQRIIIFPLLSSPIEIQSSTTSIILPCIVQRRSLQYSSIHKFSAYLLLGTLL